MKNQKTYCARNDIYNMMIRLHARHNHVDQARGLFFEMQKWRYSLSLEVSFYIKMIPRFKIFLSHGLSFAARCKPDVETYNALINVHGRTGQWRWAMNIMEDMLRAAVCICTFP